MTGDVGAGVFVQAAEIKRAAGQWRAAAAFYLLAADAVGREVRRWYLEEACAMQDRAQDDERPDPDARRV